MMEIESASNFLANLLRFENRLIKVARVDLFRRTLEDLLQHHYLHHWFPEKPCKGSGYRCLRINHKMDPLIAKAGEVCGFNEIDLRRLLPHELTLWIDPQEVSYRIGENGSICVLYDGSNQQYTPPPPPPTPTITINSSSSSTSHVFQHFSPIPVHYVQHPQPIQHPAERYSSGCKETMRNINRWDVFNVNPRSHGMLEPYVTYVSS